MPGYSASTFASKATRLEKTTAAVIKEVPQHLVSILDRAPGVRRPATPPYVEVKSSAVSETGIFSASDLVPAFQQLHRDRQIRDAEQLTDRLVERALRRQFPVRL